MYDRDWHVSGLLGMHCVLVNNFLIIGACVNCRTEQVLTAIVGVALLFRYAIKIWVRCALPQVTAPGRVWGIEDLFFLAAYGFDVTHMTFIQLRYYQHLPE